MSDDTASVFYVYGIGQRVEIAPLFDDVLPGAIEHGTSLEMLLHGELAGIASGVPLSVYGEGVLEEQLLDPEWTAARALRHQQVLEHFAARAAVVPLRFGTIYRERDNLLQMLAERQEELRTILSRLAGRDEWGITIYVNRATLLQSAAGFDRDVREAADRAEAASPGQAYLLRKKTEGIRAEAAHREVHRVIAEVQQSLAAVSEDAVRLRLHAEEKTAHGEVAAKLAFLVERARLEDFRSVAERLARAYTPSGFALEMIGPWPPYNFAATKPVASEGETGQ